MFDIALLIFFGVMTYRIIQVVRSEAQIFVEYKQSQAILLLALLFPLGPLVLLAFSVFLPFPLGHIAAVFCYVPALFSARRQLRVFDTAGTDRVQSAQAAMTQTFGTALVGLIYVAIAFIFAFGARSIA